MKTALPAPITNNLINTLGIAAFFIAVWLCRMDGYRGMGATLIVMSAYAGVILLLEVIWLRTPWRDSAGLDFTRSDESWARSFTKLLGIYGSFGFVAFFYWLFPEYRGGYYANYWKLLQTALPILLALAVPYTVFVDARMKQPKDSYYWFGRCLLGRWQGVSPRLIGQHLLGWVVKGFFLPLMFVSMIGNVDQLIAEDFTALTFDFIAFFRVAVPLLFTLDLLVAVTGYVCTLRLFDTHIRSSEPTMLGWWACISCYQPFASRYLLLYLPSAGGNYDWIHKLQAYPVLQTAWGAAALTALTIYTLSSINFGCRFSNLTHRGVLTNGMYRFTKHPAYISKNLFWWLTAMPFLSGGEIGNLRICLFVVGINIVYYIRARTEERHLSHDPDYVAYALWMNEHGIFRKLGQWFPFLRYKAPAGWEKLKRPYTGIK